jgi:beta-hydroxylase
MKTAFFSILLPHKHIPEHCGPYKGLIRYHLALKVPEPQEKCRIRVGNDIRHWQEGKSLLFDDTFPHEAWNDTDGIRVVLFLDIVRPMTFPWSVINQVLIKIIALSPFVQKGKANLEKWAKRA